MRKVLIGVFLMAIYMSLLTPLMAQPSVVGKGAILIDSKSGEVLFEKNAHEQMYPASTTKILTTLLGVEHGNFDKMVTCSKLASIAGGSSIYMIEGETIKFGDLLYGVMLKSANDGSVIVAEEVSGSVEEFANLMNQRAKETGALNTNFTNPNGMPDEAHVTTPHDMAMITREAMRNPKFREISGTKVKEIERTVPEAMTRLINHNKLLWNYEGANGGKTGYTRAAQQCLVGTAEREGQEFIAVVFGSVGTSIWSDVTSLLDYGFENYKTETLAKAGDFIGNYPIRDSEEKVEVVIKNDLYKTVPLGEVAFEKDINLPQTFDAPIKKGQVLGEMAFSSGGQVVGTVDLVAANQINVKPKPFIKIGSWVGKAVGGAVGAFAVVAVAAKLYYRRKRKIARKRRLARYKYDE